jgi:hypothetical protein
MASEEEITRLNYQHPFLRPLDKRDLAALGVEEVRDSLWDISGFNFAPWRPSNMVVIEEQDTLPEFHSSTSWTPI